MTEKTRTIAFVSYPGFTLLDMVGPLQVLGALAANKPEYRVTVVGESTDPVPTDGPLSVVAERTFAEVPDPFAIVVPGGGVPTMRAMTSAAVLDYVRSTAAEAELVTSVCTGSLILGAAGLLEGRRATTHWALRPALSAFGAVPVAQRWVQDGKVITAAGVSAGIDLALELVRRLEGEQVSRDVQFGIEYDPQPPLGPLDWALAPAQRWETAADTMVRAGLDADPELRERVLACFYPGNVAGMDEQRGLVGPDSVSWQVHSDPAMWIGGIRSLFMQALHPRAVAGVVQNSDFRNDPLGRLFRTGEFVGAATYGTVSQARAAGERVRAIHRSLRGVDPDTGERFRVDEPELLRWVHCAEVVSFVDIVRLAGMRLNQRQIDSYFTEQREVAALVGLYREEVPGSIAEMQRYFTAMRPELRAGRDARTIYEFLHRPPLSGKLRLGLGIYESLLAHLAYSLLPRWAIECYGEPAYPRAGALALLRGLRSFAQHVPDQVPFFGLGPQAVEAIRRLGPAATPSARKLPA